MTNEDELRDKLRKIEALFAGAKTHGEKEAAGAAAQRIRARLGEAGARGEVAVAYRSQSMIPGRASFSWRFAAATA